MSDSHQLISIKNTSPNFHHDAMDAGDDGVGVRNIVLKLGNNGMNVHWTLMSVGNRRMCAFVAPDQRAPDTMLWTFRHRFTCLSIPARNTQNYKELR